MGNIYLAGYTTFCYQVIHRTQLQQLAITQQQNEGIYAKPHVLKRTCMNSPDHNFI